ncbi:L-threonylcarbamoyladenylate synthase [bacterium]|nr:L-threonylcarbamoyladenylate synthase [bacterium]
MQRELIDLFHPDREIVSQAAEAILADKIICLPTETLYGLSGNALSSGVLRKINRVKGRGEDDPCIMLIEKSAASEWIEGYDRLKPITDIYWPGPLTLIIDPKPGSVPQGMKNSDGGVAIRAASLPLDIDIIRACGVPIISTSANSVGERTPSTLDGLHEWLASFCDFALDGGKLYTAEPSSIIDVRSFPSEIRVYREGAISLQALKLDLQTTKFTIVE